MMQRNLVMPMLLLVVSGCLAKNPHDAPSRVQLVEKCPDYVYKHLRNNPSLLAREGDEIVDAPAEDSAVAQQYPNFKNKGPVHDGQRITIMTAKTTYQVGEQVRVIHVLDAPEPGHELYVMGPKAIHNEFVDDKKASPEKARSGAYNGMVTKSPDVDFNYEVSTYTFKTPGEHTIQWKGGGAGLQGDLKLESNVIKIMVKR